MGTRVHGPGTAGDFELGDNIEQAADTVPIALALTVLEGGGHPDFTYSTEAENPGSTAPMDLDPGLVYTGPAGTTGYFVVSFANADLVYAAEGIADPDNEDTVSVDVFINETVAYTSTEGQTAVASEGIVAEFNGSEMLALTEGDVVRFVFQGVAANQAAKDWDLNEGGTWSIR